MKLDIKKLNLEETERNALFSDYVKILAQIEGVYFIEYAKQIFNCRSQRILYDYDNLDHAMSKRNYKKAARYFSIIDQRAKQLGYITKLKIKGYNDGFTIFDMIKDDKKGGIR